MAVSKKVPEDFLTSDNILGVENHVTAGMLFVLAHTLAIWYIWLDFYMGAVPWTPIIFELIYGVTGGLGLTIGSHRYWTHRTFKATLPLQIFLMICQTSMMQLPIRKWCLDHRLHHKYTDTNRDPHNAKRGFWFSHIGWLLVPKHPELVKELKTFDVSDLDNDPVIRFQSKWYVLLAFTFHLLVPLIIMKTIWPEMTFMQCNGSIARRYVAALHITFSVNSFAHFWGDKPYDKDISAVENPLVSIVAFGEGWHNYHHTFPWDYKASEFGWKINGSTMVLDFFAWIGWAYDLKTVSPHMIKSRRLRTGNLGENDINSKHEAHSDNVENEKAEVAVRSWMKSSEQHPVWGWDDNSIPSNIRDATTILYPKH